MAARALAIASGSGTGWARRRVRGTFMMFVRASQLPFICWVLVSSSQWAARPAESLNWVSFCTTKPVIAQDWANTYWGLVTMGPEGCECVESKCRETVGHPRPGRAGCWSSPVAFLLQHIRCSGGPPFLTSVAGSVSCPCPAYRSNGGTVNLLCWQIWGPPLP